MRWWLSGPGCTLPQGPRGAESLEEADCPAAGLGLACFEPQRLQPPPLEAATPPPASLRREQRAPNPRPAAAIGPLCLRVAAGGPPGPSASARGARAPFVLAPRGAALPCPPPSRPSRRPPKSAFCCDPFSKDSTALKRPHVFAIYGII